MRAHPTPGARGPRFAWALAVLAPSSMAPVVAAPRPQSNLEEALAACGADRAAEREAGQRWLATNLEPYDLEALVDAARDAGPEVLHRLSQALGSEDRHLGLAAGFVTEVRPELARVGRQAVRDHVGHWLSAGAGGLDADAPGMTWSELLEGVQGRWPEVYALDLRAGSLERTVHRLQRVAGSRTVLGTRGAALQLALDPVLEANKRVLPPLADVRQGAVTDGIPDLAVHRFEVLLLEIARAHGVEFEVFGGAGPRPWVRFCPPGDVRRRGAAEIVTEWLRGFLISPDADERARCARALAGTGWPAALHFLESRWMDQDDEAALSGLMLAAGRGRVVGALTGEAAFRRMLRTVDADLADSNKPRMARAENLIRALRNIGARGGDGSTLRAWVLDGWDELDTPQRFARLSILQGMGGLPDPLRSRVVGWLGDSRGGRMPPILLWQGIASLGTGVEPPRVGVLRPASRALRGARQMGIASSKAVEHLLAIGARPPEAWRDPYELAPDLERSGRLVVAAWWSALGETEAFADHLSGLEPGVPGHLGELAGLLEERRRAADPIDEAVLASRLLDGGTREERRARMALLSFGGVLPAELHGELAEELIAGEVVPGDFYALAGLVAGPAAERARGYLQDEVKLLLAMEPEAIQDAGVEWLLATERAHGVMLEQGMDLEAKLFLATLRAAARSNPHPMAMALASGQWPPAPGVLPIEVDSEDWHLDWSWFEGD